MFNNATNRYQNENIVDVTTTTFDILNNTIHLMKTGDIVNFSLPLTSKVGDTFAIARMSPYKFYINQTTSTQQIYIEQSPQTNPNPTKAGIGHGVYSLEDDTYIYRFYKFVCTLEDTIWQSCSQIVDPARWDTNRVLEKF